MMNKHIVIVGASLGIGLELVKIFAENKGNRVTVLSRNFSSDSPLRQLDNVTLQAFDLNQEGVRSKAKDIFALLPQIDILINNAGFLVNKSFSELTHEDLTRSYQVNIIGVMETIQAALFKMNPEGAHIVNISSMGGFQGSAKFPGLSAYSSSKAALASFTELFAEEFKDSAIKCNCLCLGAVQTEMLSEAFPGYEAPLKAQEMAAYIHDFSMHANRYMNGKIIPVSLSTP